MMRSNVYCTNCTQQFVAILDLELNGNHEITCPHCQHIHYRVVKDGVVTEERYRSSAGPIFQVSTSNTISFVYNFSTSTGTTTNSLWFNRSDLNLVTS